MEHEINRRCIKKVRNPTHSYHIYWTTLKCPADLLYLTQLGVGGGKLGEKLIDL